MFGICVDAQILALRPSELKLDPKSVITSDKHFFLKRLLARVFVLFGAANSCLLKFVPGLLHRFGSKKLGYWSIDKIGSSDRLFDIARVIEVE